MPKHFAENRESNHEQNAVGNPHAEAGVEIVVFGEVLGEQDDGVVGGISRMGTKQRKKFVRNCRLPWRIENGLPTSGEEATAGQGEAGVNLGFQLGKPVGKTFHPDLVDLQPGVVELVVVAVRQ